MQRVAFVLALAVLVASSVSIAGPAREPAAPQRHSKLKFNVPAQLKPNAVVGKSYEYPFCKPEPAPGLLCGGLRHKATNPKGGVPPYHIRITRGFAPRGLTLNFRNGVLSGTPAKGTDGTRIAGGPKGLWSFTVCAEDTPGLHPGPRQTVCRKTSLQVKAGAGAVTIESYVATMQAEAQEWRAAYAPAATSCAGYKANFARAAAEFSAFAARVSRIVPPGTLKGAHERLRLALTGMSEFHSLWSAGECVPYTTPPVLTDAALNKKVLVNALMLEWADAVVAAAHAAGIAVDRASLLCCRVAD